MIVSESRERKELKLLGLPLLDKVKYEKNPTAYLNGIGIVNIKNIFKLSKYCLLEFKEKSITYHRYMVSNQELKRANQLSLTCKETELIYTYIKSGEDNIQLDGNEKVILSLWNKMIAFMEQTKLIDKKLFVSLKELKDEVNLINILDIASKSIDFTKISAGQKKIVLNDSLSLPIKRWQFKSDEKMLKQLNDATLIHQSVTGLYETRIDLSKLGEE